jgi:hypothetical protein
MQRNKIATALCSILTVITFNACSSKEECKPIIIKCTIPATKYPDINNTRCAENDYKCVVSKTLMNYETMKEYALTLRANEEICK